MRKDRCHRVLTGLLLCSLVYTQNAALRAQASSPFGSTAFSEGAIRGDIFFLPADTPRLPDLQTLQPVGTIYTYDFNVSPRMFTSGFPGVTNRFEWFAIRYVGKFQAPRRGSYHFRLLSDDGARLWIDGRPVVDNDGLHPPTNMEGDAQLTAGDHFLELRYFQGPREHIALQLFWTPPGHSERLFRVTTTP